MANIELENSHGALNLITLETEETKKKTKNGVKKIVDRFESGKDVSDIHQSISISDFVDGQRLPIINEGYNSATNEARQRTNCQENDHLNHKKECKDNQIANGKKKNNLLFFREAPAHLRFNKYVLSHYRPPLDLMGCIESLTYWHNETMNILTHAIPVVLILLSIPWMLPWSQIDVPLLPRIHVFACLAPWVGSTIYHLFMCHRNGAGAYMVLLKIDLLGIWFTQTFGALITICAAIHCYSIETKQACLIFYLGICVVCLYQAMTVSTVWGRRFAFTAPFAFRVVCLFLRMSPWGGGDRNTFYYVIMQDVLAILGGYIGAVNIPEKWFPGKMDLFFNSHAIMHILVVVAVYQMHEAAILDLIWMSSKDACYQKDLFSNMTSEKILEDSM